MTQDMHRTLRTRIPTRLVNDIDGWVDHNVVPSGFIRSIIINDLQQTMEQALHNPELLGALPDVMVYFLNYIPRSAWGGPQVLDTWVGLQSSGRSVQ